MIAPNVDHKHGGNAPNAGHKHAATAPKAGHKHAAVKPGPEPVEDREAEKTGEELLNRFDKDGDGQLNEEERAAMRASFGGQRGDRGGQAGGRQRGGRGGAAPAVAQEFAVMALDRATGEVLWQKTAPSGSSPRGTPSHQYLRFGLSGYGWGTPVCLLRIQGPVLLRFRG